MERVEVWVNFDISGHDVNAAWLCRHACKETRRIVTEFSDQFGLT
jgi:hypothetical protein